MRKWITAFCILMCQTALSQTKDLYFQPGFANGASASKVFDEINYIPLQTTRKSTFGRIRKLLVSENYFIIWDADTNSIYFFDKKGQFVKKYRSHKCTIKSIQLDKKRNAVFISGSNKKYNFSQVEIEKMMEYPTNKSFARFTWSGYYDLADVRKEKVEELRGFSLSLVNPAIFNENWWAYSYVSANRKNQDNVGYEVNVFDRLQTGAQYFSYNKKTDAFFYQSGQALFFPTENKGSILFTRPYNYSIYRLTTDSVSQLYSFILPMENSLPKTFFTQSFRSKNDLELYRIQNGSQVFGIENVYKQQHYLFFTLDYSKGWKDKSFLYDESTGKFYNYGKFTPDSTNCYLPIMSGAGIQYDDGTYLYSSTSSASMFQSRDNNKVREPKYTPEVKQFLEKATRTDNPIIIQLKLKNKIG